MPPLFGIIFPIISEVNIGHAASERYWLEGVKMVHWSGQYCICAACGKLIFWLVSCLANNTQPSASMVHPKGFSRGPISPEVAFPFAKDYQEACLVVADSANASAALGRRCLQNLLREKGGVKKGDLSNEIQQVIDSKMLPSHLSEAIDSVRAIGNFAAHPIKSTNSGEIVDVEPGEAEWLLDTLEGLFDFYFVQPAILQKKRELLNQKLAESGKPPLK